MANHMRIRLLDSRLNITRGLTPDERAELAELSLPVLEVDRGELLLDDVLRRHRSFAAAVLDGIVVNAIHIGKQPGIQLLGPGDLLLQSSDFVPGWLADAELQLPGPTQLGLIDNDFILAARRSPPVIRGLFASVGDQMQRLASQLVICQLPRVDQRVLSVMWLLAESWGHVTPGGVRLPLTLTHETLGSLIGARRPTVTLALSKLTDEGAIIHQEGGWLLLKDPPMPAADAGRTPPPELAREVFAGWAEPPLIRPDMSPAYAELRDTIRRLRERHEHDREEMRDRLNAIRTERVRIVAARDRIAGESVRRRRLPPSS